MSILSQSANEKQRSLAVARPAYEANAFLKHALSRTARVKALASIALLVLAALAVCLVVGYPRNAPEQIQAGEPLPAPVGHQIPSNSSDVEKGPTGDLILESAISVKMMAPVLVSPPPSPEVQPHPANVASEKPVGTPAPTPPAGRLVNISRDEALTNTPAAIVANGPISANMAAPSSVESTNKESRLAIEVDYDWKAILDCIQTQRGELLALCHRPGSPESTFVLHREGGNYQLRGNGDTDELANLGLRLKSTDGDLPEIQRNLRNSGMQTVVFYFAPSAQVARQILKTQEAAMAKVRQHQEAQTNGTIVLHGRFSCALDGSATYVISKATLPNGTTIPLM